MTVRAVLLDAGGVLLDETAHEAAMAEAVVRAIREIVSGYGLEDYHADVAEAVRAFCPQAYGYVFWKHYRPDVERCEAAFAALRASWGSVKPPLRLMPGMDDELPRLADRFRVGLAGQYGREVLDLLREHGLIDCLAWRQTQDDFPITKPDPRYFDLILEAFGLRPEETVLVGDRIDKDVVPARMVGMRSVRIRLGLHREQEPRLPGEVPDAELESVMGLADTIQGLASG